MQLKNFENFLKTVNMTIAVVGIGLIGGSLMLDLRKRKFADRIIGVENNPQHRNIALLSGMIDEADSLENAVDKRTS